jgi:transglycosylase-like protein with SLT domain
MGQDARVVRSRVHRRRRLTALGVLCLIVVAAVALFARGRDESDPLSRQSLRGVVGGVAAATPFAYDPARFADYERRAAAGLSHVLYEKSPGGAFASARRTARFRPIIDAVARRHRLDPAMLEAIVLLESAGRPDALASSDVSGAAGLTQILAQTGRDLLHMRVDERASARLTRGIERGRKVRTREARRRVVDERFDPAKAIEATARYLDFARARLHREDLAIVAYHMGVGNLQQALSLYGQGDVPYAQLYFDSSPLRHAAAWRKLASLGDDSSTYLWRVLAAREIMRMYRDDPAALRRQERLQTARASAEEVMHPPDATEAFADPAAIARARASGVLRVLDPATLRRFGIRVDRTVGALAQRVHQSPLLYRALRPQALAVLEAIGAGTQAIAHTGPLVVTSAVRDQRYQGALAARDIEATRGFSLHTTGYAFDIARHYASGEQAQAFQFVLDRLTALDVIAWAREPTVIHVTVAGR